jgi:transposase-like protein
MKEVKKTYQASNRRDGVNLFQTWATHWQNTAPRAVACLKDDMEEMLNFMNCPVEHRIKIRTTNAIERAFREVRRRTRPMSCFQNTQSVERIIFGVINHLNQTWKEKPLKEFTHDT